MWKVVDPGMSGALMDDAGTFWDTEKDAVQFAMLRWMQGFMGRPMILDVINNTRVHPPYDHVYSYVQGDQSLKSRISASEYEMIQELFMGRK